MNDQLQPAPQTPEPPDWHRRVLLLTLVMTALVAALYGRTLHYGWHWDDYHQVRPYSGQEIAATFHGPWEPEGLEAAFYRPLTVAWFALRFKLFGYWAPAYHATSLILLVACAVGTALLATRLSDSGLVGAVAGALLLLHPVTADSLAVWSANQPHLLSLLLAVTAANWALRRQPETPKQWLPGLLAVALSFGLKEDGLALIFWLPAVLAAKRRRWPGLRLVLMVVGVAVLLVVVRGLLLGTLGGYTAKQLSVEQLIAHAVRGPATVLALGVGQGRQLLQLSFRPGEHAGLQTLGVLAEYALHYIAICSLGVGVLCARRSPAFVAGLSALLFFNAPMIWQSKSSGWHHLVLAASLSLAAAGQANVRLLAERFGTWLPRLYVAACCLLLLPVNIVATNAYQPCAVAVRSRDESADLLEWVAQGRVPEPLRLELERKRRECVTQLAPAE